MVYLDMIPLSQTLAYTNNNNKTPLISFKTETTVPNILKNHLLWMF